MSYISNYKGTEIDNSVALTQKIIDVIYPVGSIYMSVNNISPATFLGGSWTALQDRVLIGAGNSYTVNSTGGSTTHTHTSAAHTHTSAAHTHTTAGHTLTTSEIPSHRHTGLDIDKVYIFGWDTGSTSGYRFDKASLGGVTTTSNRITTSYAGGGGSHSHGNTGSTTPGATGSTTPGNTGATSTLPPYLAVYMWKRTA